MKSKDDRHWWIWVTGTICIGVGTGLALLISENLRSHHGNALWSLVLLSSVSISLAAASRTLAAMRDKLTPILILIGAALSFAGALGLLFGQHPTIASYVVAGFAFYYVMVLALWATRDRVKKGQLWRRIVRKLSTRKLKPGTCTDCGEHGMLNGELCEPCYGWYLFGEWPN